MEAEAFVPPTVSVYSRTPQDQRLVRAALVEWKPATARALYVGPGFGEDFFSWIPVGWGTGTDVQWSALEIDAAAAAAIREHAQVPVECVAGDFREGIPGGYDFIIANHVWVHSAAANARGLDVLLATTPAMLIAHDHKNTAAQLAPLLERHGYQLFQHAEQRQPLSSETWPHIFIDPFRLPAVYDDRYVDLAPAR